MSAHRQPPEALPATLKMALLSLLLAPFFAVAAAAILPTPKVTEDAKTAAAAETIPVETAASRQHCQEGQYECVPFYYCDLDNIVTDGFGLIDVRFGVSLTKNGEKGPTRTHSECREFMDVCCVQPRSERVQNLVAPGSFAPQCGKRNPDGIGVHITGLTDHKTQFGEFPWQAAITRIDKKGEAVYVGGGSLIHPKVVLTAAHSLRYKTGLEVRFGEWDIQYSSEYLNHLNMPVKRVIRHPGYNGGNLHNDIALLMLAARVDPQPHMDTICLPPPGFQPVGNCIVSGWGRDSFATGHYQGVLKSVTLPVMSRPDCEQALRTTKLGPNFRLDESFMCAGGRHGEDVCTGDGGSALACEDPARPGQYVQLGLVSWGIGCGRAGLPGVYSDVRQFTGWIHNMMTEAKV